MKRRDLDNPAHPYRLAPRDVWLAAGSPTSRPYPCRCRGRCGKKCPCRGRIDIQGLAETCCGRAVAVTGENT